VNAATRQHTPGPWSLSDSFDRVERRVQHGDDPALVWGIASGINSAHPDYLPRSEQIANARLIASAPDLLAALEKALESIEGQAELLRHCGAAYGIGATLAQARAAIAKATGGNES
jgi:hypothetical protein